MKVYQVWKRSIGKPWIVLAENIGQAYSKALAHGDFQYEYPHKIDELAVVDIP